MSSTAFRNSDIAGLSPCDALFQAFKAVMLIRVNGSGCASMSRALQLWNFVLNVTLYLRACRFVFDDLPELLEFIETAQEEQHDEDRPQDGLPTSFAVFGDHRSFTVRFGVKQALSLDSGFFSSRRCRSSTTSGKPDDVCARRVFFVELGVDQP